MNIIVKSIRGRDYHLITYVLGGKDGAGHHVMKDYVLVKKNVQTEEHVFLFCELTEEIRTKYRITHVELDTFFQLDDRIIIDYIFEIMKKMKP